MKKPKITQAMLKVALARTHPIQACPRIPGTIRAAKAAGDGSEFVKYTRGRVVFKAVSPPGSRANAILALYIPAAATVFRGTTRRWRSERKCRTKRVYVIGRVYGKEVRRTRKSYCGPFHRIQPSCDYKSGEWVEADGFAKRFAECANGIHFFETLAEARRF